PLLLAHDRRRRPGDREGALEVGVDDRVPLLLGHVEDHAVSEDAGVVDDDVDPAEGVHRGLDDRLPTGHAGHRVVVGHGIAARLGDLLHDLIGRLPVGPGPDLAAAVIVHHHPGPVLRHQDGDLPAHSPPRSSHHRRLALEHHRTTPGTTLKSAATIPQGATTPGADAPPPGTASPGRADCGEPCHPALYRGGVSEPPTIGCGKPSPLWRMGGRANPLALYRRTAGATR